MRRAAVSAVVLATALALGSPARSAPITFDLSGVVGWWSRSGDANAAIPGPPTNGGPCGATGLGSYTPGSSQDCFRYAFSPGSSITIDVTGSRVELLGGSLIVDSVQPLVFGTIALTTHSVTTIEPGLIGTLSADYITWSSPENDWMSWANFNTTGTLECNGPNCGLIAMPEGEVFPLHPMWEQLTNTTQAPGLALIAWTLNAEHDSILGSATAITAWSNVEEDGNRRQAGFTFGPTLLGAYCPEPGLPALMALAIGVLALRSRPSRSR